MTQAHGCSGGHSVLPDNR